MTTSIAPLGKTVRAVWFEYAPGAVPYSKYASTPWPAIAFTVIEWSVGRPRISVAIHGTSGAVSACWTVRVSSNDAASSIVPSHPPAAAVAAATITIPRTIDLILTSHLPSSPPRTGTGGNLPVASCLWGSDVRSMGSWAARDQTFLAFRRDGR